MQQTSNPWFRKLLNEVATGTQSSSIPLPFRSNEQPRGAYKGVRKWFPLKNYQHVNLETLFLRHTSKLMDEHNEAALNTFTGSPVNFYSPTTVEPQTSIQDRHDNPVREYVVPEMTYKFCPPGISPHRSTLNIAVPSMVTRNVLHPGLLNGKMFFVLSHNRRVVQRAGMGGQRKWNWLIFITPN